MARRQVFRAFLMLGNLFTAIVLIMAAASASSHTCRDMSDAFNGGNNSFGAELVREGLLSAYQTGANYFRPGHPRRLDINLNRRPLDDEIMYRIMGYLQAEPRFWTDIDSRGEGLL